MRTVARPLRFGPREVRYRRAMLHSSPVAPRRALALRLVRNAILASGFIAAALGIGAVGYHVLDDLPWLDATLNAAMILTGMRHFRH